MASIFGTPAIGSHSQASGTTNTVTMNTAVGDLIVVAIGDYAGAVTSVTDTIGNTYVAAPVTANGYGTRTTLFYCLYSAGANAANAIVAHTPSGSSAMFVWDVPVTGGYAGFDTSAFGNSTSATTLDTAPFTTTGLDEIIFAATSNQISQPTVYSSSSMTFDGTTGNNGGFIYLGAGHQTYSSTQSGITVGMQSTTNIDYCLTMAAFKAVPLAMVQPSTFVEKSSPAVFGANVTIGNTIIVGATWDGNDGSGNGTPVPTFQDNLGNVYTNIFYKAQGASSGTSVAIYAAPVTVGGSCSITPTLFSQRGGFGAAEFAGLNNITLLDQTQYILNISGTSGTTPSTATTDTADELLLSIAGWFGNYASGAPTWNTGYNQVGVNYSMGAGYYGMTMGAQIVSAVGAYTSGISAGLPASAASSILLATLRTAPIGNSIAGNVGAAVAGLTVAYSGTASGSVTTDSSGNYTIQGLGAGTYTVTPTPTSLWTFSPTNQVEVISGSNITGVNFTATRVQPTVPTFVQQGTPFNVITASAGPYAGNTPGALDVAIGDTIIFVAGYNANDSTHPVPSTDSLGNVFSLIQDYSPGSGSNPGVVVYAAPVTVAGASVISVASPPRGWFIFLNYAGLNNAALLDQFATAHATSGTSITAGPTSATTFANDLLLNVAYGLSGNTSTPTAGTGYTLRIAEPFAGVFGGWGVQDQIVSSTGTYSAQMNTFVNGDDISSLLVALKGVPPSHTLSGNAGVAGATVNLTGSKTDTTTADGSGNFSFLLVPDGDVQITPSLAAHQFFPNTMYRKMAGADLSNANFGATASANTYTQLDTYNSYIADANPINPAKWTTIATFSDLQNASNYIESSTFGASCGAKFVDAGTITGSAYVSCSLANLADGAAVGLILYADPTLTTNFYDVFVSRAGTTLTFDVENQVGTVVTGTATLAAPNLLRFEVVNGELFVYYNNNVVVTTFDSSVTTSGVAGLEIESIAANTNVQVLDYTVGNITPAPLATPTFTLQDGSAHPTQTVTINVAGGAQTTYYTTDGTTPNTGSPVYTVPFNITAAETIKAYSVGAGAGDSAVGSVTYSQQPVPSFNPIAGHYATGQNVTITSASATNIYYSTDGNPPILGNETLYTAPVSVPADVTLKARAARTGFVNSPIGTAAYIIGAVVATPVLVPATENFLNSVSVTITCATVGASIYYTTDGSTPSSGSTLYTGPISVSATTTIKAIAELTGYVNSAVASEVYTLVTVWSQVDSRNYATFPNLTVNVQNTEQYTVPSVDSRTAGAPVDSRTAGAPVDSRKAPNIPENSRNAPPF